jgi:carbonic anhydrase
MEKLIKGLHNFQTKVFPIQKNFFQNLAKGQDPDILFISCSDSRINPHLVTSADPGDLFILRNAGNIIPPYGSGLGEAATIEFAVHELKVKDIIICGHSHCGALKASFDVSKLDEQPNLKKWITENIVPTLELVQKNYPDMDENALMNILAQEHVLQQIENLKTHPVIADAIEKNELNLHAWMYIFESGDIFSFNIQEGQFKLIKHF